MGRDKGKSVKIRGGKREEYKDKKKGKWLGNDGDVKPCGGKRHNSEGSRRPGDSCYGNRGTDAGDSEG